jgi:hypothetical protein
MHIVDRAKDGEQDRGCAYDEKMLGLPMGRVGPKEDGRPRHRQCGEHDRNAAALRDRRIMRRTSIRPSNGVAQEPRPDQHNQRDAEKEREQRCWCKHQQVPNGLFTHFFAASSRIVAWSPADLTNVPPVWPG